MNNFAYIAYIYAKITGSEQHTFYASYKHWVFNPFNPEFTIVIIIHYKPRIAAAILDL